MKVSFILPYFNRLPYLKTTLQTFSCFYEGKDLEVLIIDDGSADDQKPNSLLKLFPKLDIKIISLYPKGGSNPCVPYNVGVRYSTGDVLVLSSPETLHTTSIFDLAQNFENLTTNDYYCFSVFCPTRPDLNEMAMLCDSAERVRVFREKLQLHTQTGFSQQPYPWANDYGSFYLHSQHRPTALNFLTAMRRELFYDLSGFDERFRKGTGFDDQEFADRLLKKVKNVRYFDDALAVHLNHPSVYGSGNPVSNQALYESLKDSPYLPNDNWGRM